MICREDLSRGLMADLYRFGFPLLPGIPVPGRWSAGSLTTEKGRWPPGPRTPPSRYFPGTAGGRRPAHGLSRSVRRWRFRQVTHNNPGQRTLIRLLQTYKPPSPRGAAFLVKYRQTNDIEAIPASRPGMLTVSYNAPPACLPREAYTPAGPLESLQLLSLPQHPSPIAGISCFSGIQIENGYQDALPSR
jgi:hypothetical protein